MDLENVSKNKINLLNDIADIPDNLHIVGGNALNCEDYKIYEKYFNKDKEIAVINEGLLRYLTFEEKKCVAKNVYDLLKKHGGVWITCDVTPKKFIEKQDECLPNFNDNLNTVTLRNNLKDRFEDVNHIKNFMKDIGFNNVEIHKFIEMKDELKSFEILKIKKNKYDDLLENAIVAVISI